jgi:hypothetical protein
MSEMEQNTVFGRTVANTPLLHPRSPVVERHPRRIIRLRIPHTPLDGVDYGDDYGGDYGDTITVITVTVY